MDTAEVLANLPAKALLEVGELPFPKVGSGKVRDIFDLGDRLLIVASDRLSAYDVIMPNGVPGKGIILTQLSLFWFARTGGLIQNHLVENHDEEVARLLADFPLLIPRSMVVRKLKPLPVEAVVRGYLSGSGWRDYKKTGALFGQPLPEGLRESDALPSPRFTPSTKAEEGHDLPLSLEECQDILGDGLYDQVVDVSKRIYAFGQERASAAGLVLADTKFEFGLDAWGNLYLIDEVLTPDSSRYWPADAYAPGRPQHAFDKQYVRDYLDTLDWDKTPPGPVLPDAVVTNTQARYIEAMKRITGAL